MRMYIFFAILIMGFFGAITAAARPDIIGKYYEEMRAPIDVYFAKQEALKWEQAKEQEQAQWMLNLKLPAFCNGEKQTAIEELECRNQKEMRLAEFEYAWKRKVAQGWKPQ